MTKTLDDVQSDMADLYDQLRGGSVDIKTASELANIGGKLIKIEQIKHGHAQLEHADKKLALAREIFETNRTVRLISDHERQELLEDGE
jgi:hypothetical protein